MGKKIIKDACLAALFLSFGCMGYLKIDNLIISSCLFSFGIIAICYFNTSLYTGVAGRAYSCLKQKEYSILSTIFLVWLVNVIVMGAIAFIYRIFINDTVLIKAQLILENKIYNNCILSFILAIYCGIMIYIAVAAIKEKHYLLAILSIMLFILNGFEHSIANIFYYVVGIKENQIFQILLHLSIITIGNFVGCNLVPFLKDK